jgi:hypothetical protein
VGIEDIEIKGNYDSGYVAVVFSAVPAIVCICVQQISS